MERGRIRIMRKWNKRKEETRRMTPRERKAKPLGYQRGAKGCKGRTGEVRVPLPLSSNVTPKIYAYTEGNIYVKTHPGIWLADVIEINFIEFTVSRRITVYAFEGVKWQTELLRILTTYSAYTELGPLLSKRLEYYVHTTSVRRTEF